MPWVYAIYILSVHCTKPYCNWLDWLSSCRSKCIEKYFWMITRVQKNIIWTGVVHTSYPTFNTLPNFLSQLLSYSIFSTLADGPFPHPQSWNNVNIVSRFNNKKNPSYHSPSLLPLTPLTPFHIITSHCTTPPIPSHTTPPYHSSPCNVIINVILFNL